MTKHNNYTVIGFKALQRAALKVAEDARKNNYKIPVWRNGRIVYKIPEVTTEQIASGNSQGHGNFGSNK
jgi:hypothetical protein